MAKELLLKEVLLPALVLANKAMPVLDPAPYLPLPLAVTFDAITCRVMLLLLLLQ
jgi:hypothetical protein